MKILLIILGVMLHFAFSMWFGTLMAYKGATTEIGTIDENDAPLCMFFVSTWPVTLPVLLFLWLLYFVHKWAVRFAEKRGW